MNIDMPNWVLVAYMLCLPPFWILIGALAYKYARPNRRELRLLAALKWRKHQNRVLGDRLEEADRTVKELHRRIVEAERTKLRLVSEL